MFEHVGREELEHYFWRAHELLRPGGTFLNHGIATSQLDGAVPRKNSFMHRYVFPDGELVPIHVTLEAAARAGFETRDVESLREHYAMTLRHWVSRLEEREADSIACTDEATYRIWRLYMSGCAHGFRRGTMSVFQTLLVRPDGDVTELPLTRGDWYAPASPDTGGQ
jgi:cyclopropane-fatty-acyl-phospholipid synthase